jgi:hypothetical protein
MKRFVLIIALFICLAGLAGCAKTGPDIVINDKTLDVTVDATTAKALGQQLLDAVPQLSALRDRIQNETGKKIKLTISVQSSPDPNGMNDLEKNNYYMYVAYSNSQDLVKTYTFLINKDGSINVFAENGDDVITVDDWLKNVGLT